MNRPGFALFGGGLVEVHDGFVGLHEDPLRVVCEIHAVRRWETIPLLFDNKQGTNHDNDKSNYFFPSNTFAKKHARQKKS